MIRTYKMPTLTAVGSVGGSAVGTVDSTQPFCARLIAAHIDYSGTATTQDITLTSYDGAPSVTFIAVSNNATDGWYYPRVQVHDGTAGGLTYDGTRKVCESIPFQGYVRATLAQGGTAGDTVDITLLLEE